MEPGDLFGEMPLFDGLGRSAEARALEPSTVIEISYAPVMALYEENPTELWAVVRLLASRLRSMDESLADSVFLDVTGRTAKRLLELADDSDEFTLPITQEELAGMVGASRERSTRQSPRSCGSDGSSRTIGATSSPTANSSRSAAASAADGSNRNRRCERRARKSSSPSTSTSVPPARSLAGTPFVPPREGAGQGDSRGATRLNPISPTATTSSPRGSPVSDDVTANASADRPQGR